MSHGVPVASNQVCIPLLDRRAQGDMSQLCLPPMTAATAGCSMTPWLRGSLPRSEDAVRLAP